LNQWRSTLEKARKLLRVKVIQSKKPTHVELLDSLNKQRISITALNTESHSSRSIVDSLGRTKNKTPGSCGIVPSPELQPQRAAKQVQSSSIPNAGRAPAFSLRGHRVQPASPRCAEFISVSGLRIDRSALFSDVRPSKRTSGVAAATLRPHAPMNSSSQAVRGRLGFAHQPSILSFRR
jgi:hypothetical protein